MYVLEDACPGLILSFICRILQQVRVMMVAGVEVQGMKVAGLVGMKEAEVEEGVMDVAGAEWVDVQGVVQTRHDCEGCSCHSC